MRFHGADQIHKLRRGVALDVELRGYQRAQIEHILATNVPLVGAWVNRNALCAKALAVARHLQHIGIIAATRIAQSRNFIDIYAQNSHVII